MTTLLSSTKSKTPFQCHHNPRYRIKREFEVGEGAPLAHQQVRAFPEWYKPWTYNYTSDGYMAVFFGGLALFAYSYMNDIKEQKGRTYRKIFESALPTSHEKRQIEFAKERVAAGDPKWTKYTHKKERAHVHH